MSFEMEQNQMNGKCWQMFSFLLILISHVTLELEWGVEMQLAYGVWKNFKLMWSASAFSVKFIFLQFFF